MKVIRYKRLLPVALVLSVVASLMALTLVNTGSALAHEHSLTLPNGRCQELANGQLGELFEELGENVDALDGKFGTNPSGDSLSPQHANVHQGAPGTKALGGWGPGGTPSTYREGIENNPVDINWSVQNKSCAPAP